MAHVANAVGGSSGQPVEAETVCVAQGCLTKRGEMRTRELARLIGTLGKLPREQRRAVVIELASMESGASSIDVIETGTPARP